jgi:hypothetical protein
VENLRFNLLIKINDENKYKKRKRKWNSENKYSIFIVSKAIKSLRREQNAKFGKYFSIVFIKQSYCFMEFSLFFYLKYQL